MVVEVETETVVVITVVNPNNKFEIYVDQSLIHSGSLLDDMTLVVVALSLFVCLCQLCCTWCIIYSVFFNVVCSVMLFSRPVLCITYLYLFLYCVEFLC